MSTKYVFEISVSELEKHGAHPRTVPEFDGKIVSGAFCYDEQGRQFRFVALDPGDPHRMAPALIWRAYNSKEEWEAMRARCVQWNEGR